uniref:4Fe-4S ferredoxin-type domain-containing protein n=1 Tax=Entamoeba invadens TaxID=33085 RepID=S0B3H0_ENTIV|nr:hypothetical protein, conserved [Entamoeba invadens]
MSQIKVDTSKCVGCGLCCKECMCCVLKLESGKVYVDPENAEKCMACAHCVSLCPHQALSFNNQPVVPLPKSHETVEDALHTRRSVRNFKGALTEEQLKELFAITSFCPSACNLRPVKLAVINRPKMTELISVLAKQVAESNDPQIPSFFKGACKLQEKFDVIGRGAPHMIVAYSDGGDEWSHDDGCIMLTQIEMYAVSKGYGTYWCGFMKGLLTPPGAMDLLGLKGKKCIECLGLGIPDTHYVNMIQREQTEVTYIN